MGCLRNGLMGSLIILSTSSRLRKRQFFWSFTGLVLTWQRSLIFGQNTHTEYGSESGMRNVFEWYASTECVCADF